MQRPFIVLIIRVPFIPGWEVLFSNTFFTARLQKVQEILSNDPLRYNAVEKGKKIFMWFHKCNLIQFHLSSIVSHCINSEQLMNNFNRKREVQWIGTVNLWSLFHEKYSSVFADERFPLDPVIVMVICLFGKERTKSEKLATPNCGLRVRSFRKRNYSWYSSADTVYEPRLREYLSYTPHYTLMLQHYLNSFLTRRGLK